jgi:sugar lactone lactonase YvrE
LSILGKIALTVLMENIAFGEGPRWHNGHLWFSDMHGQQVIKLAPNGSHEIILRLQDDQPSGLGWLPDGDLLIVSMQKRQVLRFDGKNLSVHADLSPMASCHCNDMVVDAMGRSYVGNFGFDLHNGAEIEPGELIRVDIDGSIHLMDNNLNFPNGTVITPDGNTLIIAETFAGTLTAYDIDAEGDLNNRREWAQLGGGALPDGICLDAENGVWVASPTTNECVRVLEGSKITHRIKIDRSAFACMIGGNRLFVCSSKESDPVACARAQDARIEVFPVPFTAAGYPLSE